MRLPLLVLAVLALATPALALPPPPPEPPPADARFHPAAEADAAPFLADYAARFVERRDNGGTIEYFAAAKAWLRDVCTVETLTMYFYVNDAGERAFMAFLPRGRFVFMPTGGCSAVPQGATYFDADTATTAWQGIDVLDDLLKLRDAGGRPPFKLGCLIPVMRSPPCEAALILGDIRRADLRLIRHEWDQTGRPQDSVHRFNFSFGEGDSSAIVEVTATYKPGPTPEFAGTYKITEVKVFSAARS